MSKEETMNHVYDIDLPLKKNGCVMTGDEVELIKQNRDQIFKNKNIPLELSSDYRPHSNMHEENIKMGESVNSFMREINQHLTAGEKVEKYFKGIVEDSMGLGREFEFQGNYGVSDGYISLENDEQREYLEVREVVSCELSELLTQEQIQGMDLYNTIEDYLNINNKEGE